MVAIYEKVGWKSNDKISRTKKASSSRRLYVCKNIAETQPEGCGYHPKSTLGIAPFSQRHANLGNLFQDYKHLLGGRSSPDLQR